MKRLRAIGFWTHLVAGAVAGVVILVLSLTGAALAFKPQLLRAVDTAGFEIDAAGRTALDAPALLQTLNAERPGVAVRSLTLPRDPASPVAAQVGAGTIYLDPYTGSVIGESSVAAARLFRTLEDWHRWLAMSGDTRQTGRAVTGVANLAFLFLAASGFYLWWPRAWTLRHLKPIVLFRWVSTGRARDFNWHNVAGFWSVPMVAVMTATGAFMSYPSLNVGLQRLMGGSAVESGATGRRPGPGGAGPEGRQGEAGRGGARAGVASTPVAVDNAIVASALAAARERQPEWTALTLELPRVAGAPVSVMVADGASSSPVARSVLTMDAGTGQVVRWQTPATASLAQRVRSWIRCAHTGEQWGVVGQSFAAIGCLGGALLVWTGLSLALRRLANALRRARVTREVHVPARA